MSELSIVSILLFDQIHKHLLCFCQTYVLFLVCLSWHNTGPKSKRHPFSLFVLSVFNFFCLSCCSPRHVSRRSSFRPSPLKVSVGVRRDRRQRCESADCSSVKFTGHSAVQPTGCGLLKPAGRSSVKPAGRSTVKSAGFSSVQPANCG